MRLILLHVAGARPGFGDAATHGQPAKYTFCAAENEAESPWGSYAAHRGVTAASAVTVHCGEGPHNVHDAEADGDPALILGKIASSMTTLGMNNAPISQAEFFVILGPEHARSLADSGLTRDDVSSFLYEHARMPAGLFRRHFEELAWAEWMKRCDDDDLAADDRTSRQHPGARRRRARQAQPGRAVVGNDPERDPPGRRRRAEGEPTNDGRAVSAAQQPKRVALRSTLRATLRAGRTAWRP